MGPLLWQQLCQPPKVVNRYYLGFAHHLLDVDFVLILKYLVDLRILEYVVSEATNPHQVHCDSVSEGTCINFVSTETPPSHGKDILCLLVDTVRNMRLIFVEDAVCVFAPIEVLQIMECILTLNEFLMTFEEAKPMKFESFGHVEAFATILMMSMFLFY
jgi:hypothetical protein